jgi:succinyl-CoA:(S)-malate CoA-transferase subunit B
MEQPELADESRYGTIAAREAAREAVDSLVAEWVGSRDAGEVLALCEKGAVPCGPVYSIDEIFADPQYRARENIRTVEDARIGALAVPGVVPRLGETPGEIETLGPELGAHLTEVFGCMLGLDKEEIAELKSRGIV